MTRNFEECYYFFVGVNSVAFVCRNGLPEQTHGTIQEEMLGIENRFFDHETDSEAQENKKKVEKELQTHAQEQGNLNGLVEPGTDSEARENNKNVAQERATELTHDSRVLRNLADEMTVGITGLGIPKDLVKLLLAEGPDTPTLNEHEKICNAD